MDYEDFLAMRGKAVVEEEVENDCDSKTVEERMTKKKKKSKKKKNDGLSKSCHEPTMKPRKSSSVSAKRTSKVGAQGAGGLSLGTFFEQEGKQCGNKNQKKRFSFRDDDRSICSAPVPVRRHSEFNTSSTSSSSKKTTLPRRSLSKSGTPQNGAKSGRKSFHLPTKSSLLGENDDSLGTESTHSSTTATTISSWNENFQPPSNGTKKKSYLKNRSGGKKDKGERRSFLKDRVSSIIGKEDAFAILLAREFQDMDW